MFQRWCVCWETFVLVVSYIFLSIFFAFIATLFYFGKFWIGFYPDIKCWIKFCGLFIISKAGLGLVTYIGNAESFTIWLNECEIQIFWARISFFPTFKPAFLQSLCNLALLLSELFSDRTFQLKPWRWIVPSKYRWLVFLFLFL